MATNTLPPGATQYFKRPFNKVETLDTYLGRELGIVERAIRDSRRRMQRAVSADLTLTAQDEIVYVDASAGAVTITLPDVRRFWGYEFIVKKVDASINAVTVSSPVNIDGATTYPITVQYEAHDFVSDGTQWWVV